MKNYIRLSVIALACVVTSGCSFLTLDESQYTTKEYQFAYFANVKAVCTNVYSYLQSGFAAVEGTMRECATDDAVYAWEKGGIKRYYDGTWNSIEPIDDVWGHYYSGIAAANYFLENCPEDFPESIYTNEYNNNKKQLDLFPYEVRFLRAYFHFELLKRYGNIVKVDHSIGMDEVNTLGQTPYDDVVAWIVSECDEAASKLPVTHANTFFKEVGRVTKGAAMALKSRVLLYAASPLNNPTGDKSKWEAAAVAAKELIDLNLYQLVDEEIFNNDAALDLIMGIRYSDDSSFEAANYPMGYYGGQSGVNPSHNLAEAFDLLDGTQFDYSQHKDIMFDPAQRDPRFAKTLYHYGADFRETRIYSHVGGPNGQPTEGASKTSYYLRKFIQEDTDFYSNGSPYPHCWPLFRYAEIYLNYAEALYNATGNRDFKGSLAGKSFTMSPLEAVNAVRARAGVGLVPSSEPSSGFLERIHKERRVELAFEDHRYWDLRRWKQADKALQIYGLRIEADKVESGEPENPTVTYNLKSVDKVLLRTNYWHDKMYWYPIARKETFKNNNLKQNTGW